MPPLSSRPQPPARSKPAAVNGVKRRRGEFVTAETAARMIEMFPQNIYKLLRAGRFPGAHLEHLGDGINWACWRIPVASVLAFRRRKRGPKPGSRRKSRK